MPESMQPAELPNDVMTGAEEEVIRIGEDDLGAGRSQSSGLRLFTVPCVATGMKAGVSTSPWGVQPSGARGAVGLDDGKLDGAHLGACLRNLLER